MRALSPLLSDMRASAKDERYRDAQHGLVWMFVSKGRECVRVWKKVEVAGPNVSQKNTKVGWKGSGKNRKRRTWNGSHLFFFFLSVP